MRCRHLVFLLGAVATLATACAFSGKDPLTPGTPLGTFHVDAALVTDACGGAPAPWGFDVNLARDEGDADPATTLYWIQGGVPVMGHLDGDLRSILQSSDTRTVHDSDARRGLGACAMTRVDSVEVAIASDLATFRGRLSYAFAPTDGSDCADQLVSAGGPYAALPCTITYDLHGSRTVAPKPH